MQIHRMLSDMEPFTPVRPAKSAIPVLGWEPVPVSLETDFFGFPLINPFILSASPLTDGLEEMRAGLKAGWAGGVMKTAFDGIPIHIPDQYMTQMDPMTFGNADNVSGHPLSRVCSEIPVLRDEFPDRMIIGGTGGPVTGNEEEEREGWASNTLKLEAAGAMGVEYSLSCPQGGDGSEGAIASQNAKLTAKIVDYVMNAGDANVPKLFKMSGAVTSIVPILRAVKEVFDRYPDKKGGITLANSFPVMDFKHGPHKSEWEEGAIYGMAGAGVLNISYKTLADAAPLGLTISGNGGVVDYKSAAHFLALGTNSVQVCSLPSAAGLGVIDELNSGLAHMMQARGIETIAELQGRALPMPVTDFMDLTPVKTISSLARRNDCVSCGNCSRCWYGAISMYCVSGDPLPVVDPAKCIGCSLCVLKCPTGALSMRPRTPAELAVCPE
jgi:dihydropyrimidine dehydrogenase (NAD+) subunit PreA